MTNDELIKLTNEFEREPQPPYGTGGIDQGELILIVRAFAHRIVTDSKRIEVLETDLAKLLRALGM